MHKLLSHKWLILALLISVWAGRMLLTTKHFYTHDDIQVFRLNEYLECFDRGDLPCRWSPALGKGYGYPLFNYYPPMIYVVPALIHLLGFSLITSLNLFMFLTFILAAWGMYNLVKALTEREDLAFLASALYTLYPWHATNVFIRGVYGENLAWSLAPWIFLTIFLHISKGRRGWLPPLFALTFLTHIISSFLLVGLGIIWTVILTVIYHKPLLRTLFRLAGAIVVGVGISAFFFIPAILEKGLVQSETMTQGYYAYSNHFVGLKQLFCDYTWVYGASYFGTPPEEMGFMVGHIHELLLAIGLIFGWLYFKKSSAFKLALSLLVLAVALLFMAHSKSTFIWSLLPPLAYVQFPWRFIGWAGLPLVLSISLTFSALPLKIFRALSWVAVVGLLIYSSTFFAPRGYDRYTDSDFVAGTLTANQQVSSIYDYLPKTVKTIPEVYAKDSDYPTPIFYFPGWTASTPIQVDPSTGIIMGSPPGLVWKETPFRLSMDIISLISLSGYLFYLMYNKEHVKF